MIRVGILILSAVPLLAQPSISKILNAASKASPAFKHGAISPGMRVTILGQNLGPDTEVDAPGTYPLPTRQGLGGVTARIRLIGTPDWDDCIILLASSTKVGIVLPNTTGVGNSELQLSYGGRSVTVPVKTVNSSPGLYTMNGYGSGQAVVVNVNSQTDRKNNSLYESAKPGQGVAILATGLGGANGNEALRPVPGTLSPPPEVWIGGQPAQVFYAGRASCCSGYDELDVVLPSGVATGCYVSVQVREGGVASNTATMAIMPRGGPCSDPLGLSPDLLSTAQANDSAAIGSINLMRSLLHLPQADGSYVDAISETLTGTFNGFNASSLLRAAPDQPSIGSCITSFTPEGDPNPSAAGDALDAGVLTVLNATDSRTINKGDKNYSGPLGGGDSALPLFLDQGPFSVSNGDGASVGAFQAQTDVQPEFVWNELRKIQLGTPLQHVNVTWSGGDATGSVLIVGAVIGSDGASGGGFICAEKNSAGHYDVPDVVLADMPVNAQGLGPIVLLVASYANPTPFQAAGLDQATITHISSSGTLAILKLDTPSTGGGKK